GRTAPGRDEWYSSRQTVTILLQRPTSRTHYVEFTPWRSLESWAEKSLPAPRRARPFRQVTFDPSRVLAGQAHFAIEGQVVADEHTGAEHQAGGEGFLVAVADADHQPKATLRGAPKTPLPKGQTRERSEREFRSHRKSSTCSL